VLELFPESSRVEGGELRLGGLAADELAERFGTPLVVYCEQTLRAQARGLRGAAGEGGRVFYGTKAFPNVAVLRLLREEGIGADVASAGELAFARASGLSGAELVVHGNNKDEALLREAARKAAPVVVDAADEVELAAAAGVERVLVRVTLGVDADTHEAVVTGHHGSKFGLPPAEARAAVADALARGLHVLGPHVHVGSQLPDFTAPASAVSAEFVGQGLPAPEVWLEPGRCLVGRAGVTLYRVGAVKRLPGRTWVAIDGGMSDNPRPQLYGARYTAISALRADEEADEVVSIAGMHCESGDVLIDDVALPEARRGDLLAVPATGAYTLAMSSNYNGVGRPAAILVRDGAARLIRRRETVDDLLGLEAT
jgi:diaminopimelate decarboxylase